MTTIVAYELSVCVDCRNWVANADDSSLDLLPGDAADTVRARRDAKVATLDAYFVPGDREYGFLHRRCELCDALAGDRYEITGLVESGPDRCRRCGRSVEAARHAVNVCPGCAELTEATT